VIVIVIKQTFYLSYQCVYDCAVERIDFDIIDFVELV